MPCDAIQLMRVELPKMDKALRDLALKAMGAVVQSSGFLYQGDLYRFEGDRLVGRDASVADTLKQAYSAEVVKYTARRAGWAVKQTGQFQYQVFKR
jgi:hypothetical protein